MNANRRADLQRKLGVAPVPKPPAGLAAKIKSDIPKELRFNADEERARFAHSSRISLAVAASVIVVIASAYLALQVTDNSKGPLETRPAAAKHPVLQAPPAVVAPPPAAAPADLDNAPKLLKETRVAVRRQKKQEAEPKNELLDRAERAEPAAAAKTMVVTAAAPSVAQNAASVEEQTTTSPISGRRYGFADVRLTPWPEVPREVKLRILKDELAHGADAKEVVKAARDAGLTEFADSVEKKH